MNQSSQKRQVLPSGSRVHPKIKMRIGHRLKWTVLKLWLRFQFPSVRHISTPELAAWLEDSHKKPPLLLDARTTQEYAVSHLPQAYLICSPSDLKELIDSTKLSPSTPIVTYCSIGYRSALLAQKLQQKGYKRVFNLQGSLFAWFKENRPVFQNERQVWQIHPYNRFWSFWLE